MMKTRPKTSSLDEKATLEMYFGHIKYLQFNSLNTAATFSERLCDDRAEHFTQLANKGLNCRQMF